MPAAAAAVAQLDCADAVSVDEQFEDELHNMHMSAASKTRMSKAEAAIVTVLEQIWPGVRFDKVRNLPWLKNPATKRHLELDIYAPSLKLAAE